MNEIESELKAKLEAQPLQSPSLDLDKKIEMLINNSEASHVNKTNTWTKWFVAASAFAVLLIGTWVNQNNTKDPLQLAFEDSFRLEQQIKKVKPMVLQPVLFLEEDKINQEISELDRQLQLMLLLKDNDKDVLILMKQRISKLRFLLELYNTSQPAFRI